MSGPLCLFFFSVFFNSLGLVFAHCLLLTSAPSVFFLSCCSCVFSQGDYPIHPLFTLTRNLTQDACLVLPATSLCQKDSTMALQKHAYLRHYCKCGHNNVSDPSWGKQTSCTVSLFQLQFVWSCFEALYPIKSNEFSERTQTNPTPT